MITIINFLGGMVMLAAQATGGAWKRKRLALQEHAGAVVVVVAVHAALFSLFRPQPSAAVEPPEVISVQLMVAAPPVTAVATSRPAQRPPETPRPAPAPSRTAVPAPAPTPTPKPVAPAQPQAAAAEPAPPVAAAPAAPAEPARSEAPAAPVSAPAPEPVLEMPRVDASAGDNAQPTYPAQSRRLGEQGTVTLELLILSNGRVGDVNLRRSSGYPRLDAAAIEAARLWVFKPARRGGEPIDFRYVQTVRFRLDR